MKSTLIYDNIIVDDLTWKELKQELQEKRAVTAAAVREVTKNFLASRGSELLVRDVAPIQPSVEMRRQTSSVFLTVTNGAKHLLNGLMPGNNDPGSSTTFDSSSSTGVEEKSCSSRRERIHSVWSDPVKSLTGNCTVTTTTSSRKSIDFPSKRTYHHGNMGYDDRPIILQRTSISDGIPAQLQAIQACEGVTRLDISQAIPELANADPFCRQISPRANQTSDGDDNDFYIGSLICDFHDPEEITAGEFIVLFPHQDVDKQDDTWLVRRPFDSQEMMLPPSLMDSILSNSTGSMLSSDTEKQESICFPIIKHSTTHPTHYNGKSTWPFDRSGELSQSFQLVASAPSDGNHMCDSSTSDGSNTDGKQCCERACTSSLEDPPHGSLICDFGYAKENESNDLIETFPLVNDGDTVGSKIAPRIPKTA